MPASSRKPIRTFTPFLLDPKAIRHDLRALIRGRDRLPQRKTPRQTHVVLNEIWQYVASAYEHMQHTEYSQALTILQAVTDVFTDQWMHLNDIHSEVSDFFQELACVWTETLLCVDLTAKERNRWAKQFAIWQARFAGLSMGTAFDAPQAAIREGWDPVPLQRILQGISLDQRAWEGEIPTYALQLTHARLAVLEQRKQFQHYLYLAKAEGHTRAYVIHVSTTGTDH